MKKYGTERGSSAKCARALGFEPQWWTEVEKGRIAFTPEKLMYLGKFFDCDPGRLLTGGNEKPIEGEPALAIAETEALYEAAGQSFSAIEQLKTILDGIRNHGEQLQADEALLRRLLRNLVGPDL